MSKKIILIFVLLAISSLLLFLGYNIVTKTKKIKEIVTNTQTLPDFELLTLDNKKFTQSDVDENQPIVFVYFNSECDYCEYEAESIYNNLDALQKIQFLFVSTEPLEIIREFSKIHKLNNQPKITFLHDSTDILYHRFGASSFPYLLIYDGSQNLVLRHKGLLNVESILESLKNQ